VVARFVALGSCTWLEPDGVRSLPIGAVVGPCVIGLDDKELRFIGAGWGVITDCVTSGTVLVIPGMEEFVMGGGVVTGVGVVAAGIGLAPAVAVAAGFIAPYMPAPPYAPRPAIKPFFKSPPEATV
jgi:hypothetical protein